MLLIASNTKDFVPNLELSLRWLLPPKAKQNGNSKHNPLKGLNKGIAVLLCFKLGFTDQY